MEFIPNYVANELYQKLKHLQLTNLTNMDKDTIGVYIWPWCWVSEQVDFQVP